MDIRIFYLKGQKVVRKHSPGMASILLELLSMDGRKVVQLNR